MRHHLALASIALAALTACGNSSSSSTPPADGGGGGSGSGSGGSSGGGSGSSSGGGSGSSSGGGSGSSSGGGSGSSSGGGSGSSSGSAADSGTDGGPPAFDPSVYQHHRNGTRDGLYIDPVFTQTAAKTTHVLTNFVGTVSTTVYAQPLYVLNGPSGTEAFLVATEDNNVTTYNATTGAIIWNVGPSIIGQYATKNPPGGSVGSTHIGITGTPYIDIGSRTIFFDAMTTPDNSATYHHKVFALNLDTGAAATNWPADGVDVDAALASQPAGANAFSSGVQNQRGALQFLNGVLYVPYGGYDGDGGNYYGSVVGFPVATPQTPTWWHTTALRGGVWGPGALPTDGTSIFPITGNTSTNGTWGGGEAVIRLGAGPTFSGNTADYYAPSNWQDLDNGDVDLGGASEVLFDMPGATNPHLVAAGGKDGNLYILNRDNLGGIGGELLKTSMSGSQIKGALAAYTTALGTYVAFHIEGGTGSNCPANEGGNLVVAQITQSPIAAKTVWCAAQTGLGSPMITTTDGTSNPIVWAASNALYGWNGDTGALIVGGTTTQMSGGVQGWNGPINAKGRMAVGVNGQLYVFTP
jgi:hypothetical protein